MISKVEDAASAVLKRTDQKALKLRIVGGLITGVVWVIAVLLGRTVFSLLVGAIVVLSIDELATLLKWRGFAVSRPISMAAGGVLAVLAYFAGVQGVMAGLVFILLIFMVRQAALGLRFADTALNITAIIYVGVLLSYLIFIYGLKGGQVGVVIVLLGTWASDVAAYFAGSVFGRTPLAPAISAKKTWEGAVAGLIAPSVLIATAGAIPQVGLAGDGMLSGVLRGLAIGMAIGVFAPLGDLAESRLKRELNIKDSGNIIPGHGGFLDRLDSLMFASVGVYYLWLWLAG
ncbi:MAG: phosphatidate cytidylyltransferase [Actinobacteria bacterium]|nr:phosphatidate cytidylyltransferase [Actinomycetota bacterium]